MTVVAGQERFDELVALWEKQTERVAVFPLPNGDRLHVLRTSRLLYWIIRYSRTGDRETGCWQAATEAVNQIPDELLGTLQRLLVPGST